MMQFSKQSNTQISCFSGKAMIQFRQKNSKNSVRKGECDMERILDVAQYLIEEYKKITGEAIDEMKLHKLLYFAQRESLALTGEPLFQEEMNGWIYGPVSPLVRTYFSENGLVIHTNPVSDSSAYILKNAILEYGPIASWKLSEMSHKEKSWLNSRKGLEPNQNGNEPLKLADIKEDARKVRPYDHMWDMYYDEFDDFDEGVVEE